MLVYGFCGESGCGKSYRAPWVASRLSIPAIIDDGLLISENKIVAGISAKKEKTKVAAVRRALFTDPVHARSVQKALSVHHYDKILVVGTSENMIQKIVKALELGEICHIIQIRDIATEEEIAAAKRMRKTEGKHVIPVPTFEIKKDFSGYFIDSITSVFFPKSKKFPVSKGEKTIVRPTFSYLGDYTISDNVIADICMYEAANYPEVVRVAKANVKSSPDGAYISLDLILKFGKYSVTALSRDIAKKTAAIIDQMTSINVCQLNINIKALI
jgi:uncharacterized alkaline shock family protein YloU